MTESFADVLAAFARIEQERNNELAEIHAELARLKGPAEALSIAEFARRTGSSDNTVRRAIREGRIRTIDLGDRTVRIPSSELEGAFVAEHRRRQIRAVPAAKPAPGGRRPRRSSKRAAS